MSIGCSTSLSKWTPEDGCLAVHDVGDTEGTIAFTSFGIENLKELIEIHKADPSIIERYRELSSMTTT
jgi:hypothetical protein